MVTRLHGYTGSLGTILRIIVRATPNQMFESGVPQFNSINSFNRFNSCLPLRRSRYFVVPRAVAVSRFLWHNSVVKRFLQMVLLLAALGPQA